MKLNLNVFFDLVKKNQKPYEEAMTAAMQHKVDWIKKTSTYDLNQRQKDSLERDKNLIVAMEGYVMIQHKIIAHLFEKLETAQAETAAHFADKLAAEEALRTYIQRHHNGDIQPAA